MLSRYQVRIRRREDVHTFALRLNVARTSLPDPKAAQYRAALHLAILRGPLPAQRLRQPGAMVGGSERA